MTVTNNPCTPATATYTVNVNALPSVAPIGGGASTVCVNQQTPAFTNATAGGTWSITNGTGTASIDAGGVVTGLTAGTVTVVYTYSDGSCSNTATAPLTVIAAPPLAPTITAGTTTVCSVQSGLTYSITPVGGTATYLWTAPTGWVINLGQGTNSITATSGNTGQTGDITVTVSNECGNGFGTFAVSFVDDIGFNGNLPLTPLQSVRVQLDYSWRNGSFGSGLSMAI